MKDLSKCELTKLTEFQIKQKAYILNEYPMLDDMMVETILRLTPGQTVAIINDMKDGTLAHEKDHNPDDFTLQTVKVE